MASSKSKTATARLRAGTPVLITESVEEFVALRKQLDDEIGPNGVIEQGWVDGLAAVMWDIIRLLRWKSAILNGAFCEALQEMLKQVWSEDFEDYPARDRTIQELAWQWLANDSDARAEVSGLLAQHQLDETAIEAEAFRLRAQELETLDRMLGLAEVRREKSLIGIAAYREKLGQLVRKVTDQMLKQENVLQVVALSKRNER
jgi:hypothetical protein